MMLEHNYAFDSWWQCKFSLICFNCDTINWQVFMKSIKLS